MNRSYLVLILALFSLNLISCAGSSGVALNPSGQKTCPQCLELRVFNQGPHDLEKLEIQNQDGETWAFGPVPAGKYSPYIPVKAFCLCGYSLQAEYRGENGQILESQGECLHVMPCTDYLSGKARIRIQWTPSPGGKEEWPPYRLVHQLDTE